MSGHPANQKPKRAKRKRRKGLQSGMTRDVAHAKAVASRAEYARRLAES